MLGEDDQCLLFTLVCGWADGKTLSTCCCVSRQWSQIARQDQLWKNLCCANWKSSATERGFAVIRAVGGYQKYYALRVQAQEHDSVPLRRRPVARMFQKEDFTGPTLQMEDFIMFVDIRCPNGASVCSLVLGGEELKPLYPVPNGEQERFSFGWEFPDLTSDPFSSNQNPHGSLSSQNSKLPSVPLGREASKGWTIGELMKFEVSWAVMEKSTCKMLQLLWANKGDDMIDYICCIFQDLLFGHYCGHSAADRNSFADVHIMCETTSDTENDEQQLEDDWEEESIMVVLQGLRFGLIPGHDWKYFTQLEACRYLKHLFDLEIKCSRPFP